MFVYFFSHFYFVFLDAVLYNKFTPRKNNKTQRDTTCNDLEKVLREYLFCRFSMCVLYCFCVFLVILSHTLFSLQFVGGFK